MRYVRVCVSFLSSRVISQKWLDRFSSQTLYTDEVQQGLVHVKQIGCIADWHLWMFLSSFEISFYHSA